MNKTVEEAVRSRWQVILRLTISVAVATNLIGGAAPPVRLPGEDGAWTMPKEGTGRLPSAPVRIEISGVGRFDVDPADTERTRPDLFRPGHRSVYDLIAHLGTTGRIDLRAHFDEDLETHVIEWIDGRSGWWYQARYDGGWFERNATRIDLYPVKDGMTIKLMIERSERLDCLYASFRDEVAHRDAHDGRVVIPSVEIEGPRGRLTFEDVEVTAHEVRSDLWQSGTVTALDILLSLGEQGRLSSVGLRWYDAIGGAEPVDSYFVERVEADGFVAEASGRCGFVYEVGDADFPGFAGSHIHLPTDARALVAPEYALWFWLCL